MWWLALGLIVDLRRGVLWGFISAALLFVMLVSPMVGFLVQPWSPWWIGQRGLTLPVISNSTPLEALAPSFGPQPIVSDAQRFALAMAAGFSRDESITATAISVAENGGGDPAALSGVNRNGTRDLGLWQINSVWWSQFGGPAALIVPATNAAAARAIYLAQGWCAWSTYDARCGAGHTGAYSAYLGRAVQAGR